MLDYMWGVGIQRNLFNEKTDIKIQLFGNSEQLKDIKIIQSRIGRCGQSFEIIQSGIGQFKMEYNNMPFKLSWTHYQVLMRIEDRDEIFMRTRRYARIGM